MYKYAGRYRNFGTSFAGAIDDGPTEAQRAAKAVYDTALEAQRAYDRLNQERRYANSPARRAGGKRTSYGRMPGKGRRQRAP